MRPQTSILAASVVFSIMILLQVQPLQAAPIETIQGTIVEVGEGYLRLKPENGSPPRTFILRWKARFDPPKLPMKGDRALIQFKTKEQGAVIYAVKYLAAPQDPGSSQ